MGCHTWFHKKSDLSIDSAKKMLIKSHEINIKELNLVSEETCLEYGWEKSKLIELYQRRIKRIKNPKIKTETIYNALSDFYNFVYTDVGLFEEINEYHNLFRIHGYPEDCLYSLEETLQFIKNYEKTYGFKVEIDESSLREYWEKYPNGMINFG